MAGCTLGDSASPGEGAVIFITKASRAVYVYVWEGGSSMKISNVRERIKHVATTCKCVCTYCHMFLRKGKSVLCVCARGFIFARQEKRRHRDVQ